MIHTNDPAGVGAISYSLQYSHSIDLISDSVTFSTNFKDLFMMCEIDGRRESDAQCNLCPLL
jgi:hypothetical protein